MENQTAIDRLKLFAKWARSKGYVKGETSFEAYCGLSPRYMYNLKQNGKGCVGSDKIAFVAMKFPMLNVRWLCTGEGRMVEDETTASEDFKKAIWHIEELREAVRKIAFSNNKIHI